MSRRKIKRTQPSKWKQARHQEAFRQTTLEQTQRQIKQDLAVQKNQQRMDQILCSEEEAHRHRQETEQIVEAAEAMKTEKDVSQTQL